MRVTAVVSLKMKTKKYYLMNIGFVAYYYYGGGCWRYQKEDWRM